MAARLKQGEDQRVEFVPHRQAGEGQHGVLARGPDGERGPSRVVAVVDQRDAVGERGDLLQQFPRLGGRLAVVERRDEFDRALDSLEIAFELSLDRIVEHGWPPYALFAWRGGRASVPG